MKFSEAITELNAGKKVSRSRWTEKMYLSMARIPKDEVKAYRSAIRMYNYDSSIFMCDGWFIEGDNREYVFHEIADLLYEGEKARLKEWSDGFIYYDREEKDLVYHSMEEFFFVPEFLDLMADDWVVVE